MSARGISRREAAARGVAMLVLAAAAAGPAKTEELDGELLADAAEYLGLRASYLGHYQPIMQSGAKPAGQEAWDHCNVKLWPRELELIARITDAQARTPEGLRAKAAALEALLHQDVPEFTNDTFEDCAEDHERLAMSLARDTLGRTGA